jgi:type VI secretion system protein VasL
VNTRKHLKTGGDPRQLPDYGALRDEIAKLSHPARPDVDWPFVEKCCLALFEHNGVELQTAAWYTLARTHIAGLPGLNEGLAMLEALIARQWALAWPRDTHARITIISGLFQRLQKVMRTLALDSRDDLAALYQSEKLLGALREALARHQLSQGSASEGLRHQVQQAIVRLENQPHQEPDTPEIVLPPQALAPSSAASPAPDARRVWVVPAEQVAAEAPPPKARSGLKPFIAGAACALALALAAFVGWRYLQAPDSASRQLASGLAPLPQPLSSQQLSALKSSSPVVRQEKAWVEKTQRQLARLESLAPDWPLRQQQALIAQAESLWPENSQVMQMRSAWRQQTEASALPEVALNGWHQGMSKLQRLTDRLNGLDEKRGGYMTVSELKSAVFSIVQDFNQNPPAEEQLRQLKESRDNSALSAARQRQAELRLQQLQASYFLLTKEKEEAPLSAP